MNAIHPSGSPNTNLSATPKTHPLILAASVAVLFASATSMAYMFGLIGNGTSPSSPAKVSVLSPVNTAVAASAPAVLSESIAPAAAAQTVPQTVPQVAPAQVTVLPALERVTQPTSQPAATVAVQRAPKIIYVTKPVPVTAPMVASAPTAAPVVSNTVTTPPVIAQNPNPVFNERPSDFPVIASAPVVAQAPVLDPNIGTVTSIREDQRKGQGSGLGAIAGGAVGGTLGNQMGKGNGRTAATILGAIGGGLIGNEIEKSQRVVTTYVATVRMPDGAIRNFTYDTRPALQVGDKFDVRTAPGGSQASYSPRYTQKTRKPVESDTMRSDNPYNT